MRKRFVVLIAVALLVVVAVDALAAPGGVLTLPRWVIGGGGGRSQGGNYVLHATIGQGVAGRVNGSVYDLCSGYWCGLGTTNWVYLPLVLRN